MSGIAGVVYFDGRTADARTARRMVEAMPHRMPHGAGERALGSAACVKRLRGDFAFAVWDQRNRTLVCARDHFGARPLCVYRSQAF